MTGKLPFEDLQVGDILSGWGEGSWLSEWTVESIESNCMWLSAPGHAAMRYQGLSGLFWVERPTVPRVEIEFNVIIGSNGVIESVTPASRWNGKCPRCGRGTYQGFSKLEHEGGTCG